MVSINIKLLRRSLVVILLGACSMYLSGYIFLDTPHYNAKIPVVSIRSSNYNQPRDKDMTHYTARIPVKSVSSGDNHQPRDKEPYDVIILTYMRSGSSFIGRLVGARNDTFYWYEPLWKTHKWSFHSTGQMVCDFRTGCSNVSGSVSSIQQSLKFLLDIYKCNLKEHYNRFDDFIAGRAILSGATGRVFQDCIYPLRYQKNCLKMKSTNCKNCSTINLNCYKFPVKSFKECYNEWIKRCNSSTHRATKVLRMDNEHAQYLLENHKRLKLVQIFRDPRAVISSRKDTGWYYMYFGGKSQASDAKVLCERMEKDIVNAEKLKSLYPDRVKIIQYEDFYDPNRTARILFDFLNMNMTEYVKSRILAPLLTPNPKTRRGFHPESYRYKLDSKSILDTNMYCKKVFRNLGLRILVNASEITNKKLSVINKLPYPLE